MLGIDPGVLAAYGGSASAGLIHGMEPGHGWPLTVRAAATKSDPIRFGVKASLLLAAGHFISTLVVVALFFVAAQLLGLLQRPLFLVGGVLLIGVALFPYAARAARRWRRRSSAEEEGEPLPHDHGGAGDPHDDHRHDGPQEHGHDGKHARHGHTHAHPRDPAVASPKALFISALVLGFVHEEEFALIGFVAAGANALVVGLIYGLAVTTAIVGVTVGALKLASRKGGLDPERLAALAHVSSGVMLLIGAYYLARGFGLV